MKDDKLYVNENNYVRGKEQFPTEPLAEPQGDQRGKAISDRKELAGVLNILGNTQLSGTEVVLVVALIPEQIDKNSVRFKFAYVDGNKPQDGYLTFNRKILPTDFDRSRPDRTFKLTITTERNEVLRTEKEVLAERQGIADAELAAQAKDRRDKIHQDLIDAAAQRTSGQNPANQEGDLMPFPTVEEAKILAPQGAQEGRVYSGNISNPAYPNANSPNEGIAKTILKDVKAGVLPEVNPTDAPAPKTPYTSPAPLETPYRGPVKGDY